MIGLNRDEPQPSPNANTVAGLASARPSRWRVRALWFLLGLISLTCISCAVLYWVQDSIIYHPMHYDEAVYRKVQTGFSKEIVYHTAQGRQVALYVAPKAASQTLPERIWIIFGGNMSLALNWQGLLSRVPDTQAGFLLFELPGYGHCEGKPSLRAILESSEGAMRALAQQLHANPDVLFRRLCILGYSLGTGSALQLAVRQSHIERIVLVAPYSSMMAMARMKFGWPLCCLLRHRFDNRARLNELSIRPDRPTVTILHGDRDEVIPVTQTRDMAASFNGWVTYHEIIGADHTRVLTEHEPEILSAMFPDFIKE